MNTVKKVAKSVVNWFKKSMVRKRKGKGRFRKVFLPIVIFIVSVLIIIGYGHHNLRAYSIYYAQNIPHKSGTAPVMCA